MAQDETNARLVGVSLDEKSLSHLHPDLDREKRIDIHDLLESNQFMPVASYPDGYTGPYQLTLRVTASQVLFDILNKDGDLLESIALPGAGLNAAVRDYISVCDSYFAMANTGNAHQIETIDMARRAIHNEAADALMEQLAPRLTIDLYTARRLFRLICLLELRG